MLKKIKKLIADVDLLDARVESLQNQVISMSVEYCQLLERMATLEDENKKLREAIDMQDEHLAETLSKKWDEGISKVTEYNPFYGMNFGLNVQGVD